MNWFRPTKKHVKPSFSHSQTFILEPLITPSGLVDDLPDPALLQLHSVPFDHVPLPESTLAHLPGIEPHAVSHLSGDPVEVMEFRSLEIPEAIAPLVLPDATFNSGMFTVGASGQVSIDFLFDGGGYQGEVALFSLEGLELGDLNTPEGMEQFIHTAAERAHSNSPLGHVVISDATEGARFDAMMGEASQNSGVWQQVKTFEMNAGSKFAVMLVPNGTVQDVLNGCTDGAMRPLFSLATANPTEGFHLGQIADVTGEGNTFVFEDLRVDGQTDRDYNDVIFQIRGATGEAQHLDEVIDPNHDWRTTDMGKALIAYAEPFVTPQIPQPTDDPSAVTIPGDYLFAELTPSEPGISTNLSPAFEFPLSDQPLIGIIDTGFTVNNPYIDTSLNHIMLGYDWIDGDTNPFLQPGQGDEHGSLVAGIIGATHNNDFVLGVNNDAPLWLGRAVGSDQWAKSLVEFVNAAKESQQPHAIANLSFDLTRYDAGGTSTRFEFTQEEWNALQHAHDNGVLIVAASGSDGGEISALGQASRQFDNIITVGSVENVNPLDSAANGYDRGSNSNYGAGLDIVAEGGTPENPLLSILGDGLGTISGSSAAAAKVSGATSLIWAANPGLSYQQVIDILNLTATDLNMPNWDMTTGTGLLNIGAAIHLAKATTPEPTVATTPTTPQLWNGGENAVARERPTNGFNYPIQSESFTGKVAPIGDPFYGVSYRKSPNLLDKWGPGIAAPSNSQLSFNAWTYGEPVADFWTGKPDALWFRYQEGGRDYWVPSAYINGYPLSRPPLLPQTGRSNPISPGQLGQLLSKARLTIDEIITCRQLIAQLPQSSRAPLYEKLQYKVPYFNQRDNASYSSTIGDVMCNLTTLASCLTYLGVKNPNPSQQFEDYLESVLRNNPSQYPSFNGTNARYWWSNLSKLANELGITSSGTQKFPAFPSTNQQFFKDFVSRYWEPALNQGKAIMAGVSNTSAGHIIKVLDIDWNRGGIVVDDPFGVANTSVSQGYSNFNTKNHGVVNTQQGQDEGGVGNDNFWSWSYCAKVFGETWYLLLG